MFGFIPVGCIGMLICCCGGAKLMPPIAEVGGWYPVG